MYLYLCQDRSLIFQVEEKDECNFETVINCFSDNLEKFRNVIEGIKMVNNNVKKNFWKPS